MNSYIKSHMREELKNHKLAFIVDEPECSVFVMKNPSHGYYSLTIISCRSRITMHGDLTFGGPNGCVSTVGYDVHWLKDNKCEDYLCEKFLNKEWQWKVAEQELRQELDEWDDEDCSERAKREIEDILSGNCMFRDDAPCEFEFREALGSAGYEHFGHIPGYDYPLNDAGWLCAVQEKFSELWHAKEWYESVEELNQSVLEEA